MRWTSHGRQIGVPLRFPRPAVPVIAAGMTAVWVLAASAPALADQTRHQEWWLNALDVPQAWHASRGAGVTVAVLSDGVDATQQDISRSVTVGPDLTSTTETATTYVGLQGTPIASLIAGRGHGARGRSGIIGVAPRARVLSIRVTLDPRDPALDIATTGAGLPTAIAAGIRYAVNHHATVIDLPLDPGQPNPAQVAALPIPPNRTTAPQLAGLTAAAGGSTAEKQAIAFALRKGVLLVAPAGDNAAGTDALNYPAAYPGVIAVGGFDHNFARASYSSHQPYVTLTAAGQGVLAADTHDGYAAVNSTTTASAMVSGIAALIRSKFPSLSPAQVTRLLTGTTLFQRPGGRRNGYGYGTVDAGRAMAAAAALTAPASHRAGAGAKPWSSPASPGAPAVSSDALMPRVLRAAILSAAVLVVLLAAALGYAAIRRRRERGKSAPPVADWAPAAQPAYAPYGADADRMLEYFAAPSTTSAAPADLFPTPMAGRNGAAGPAAASGVAAGVAGEGTGVGAWVPLGSGSRGHSRQPQVSGTPPWEPAAQPDSELPWATTPGPGRSQGRPAAAPAAPAIPPAPAASAAPASDSTPAPAVDSTPAPAQSAWPSAAAATTGGTQPSPSAQPWQDLTDRSLAAIRAVSENSASPRPAAEAWASQPPAPAAPPAEQAPATASWEPVARPPSPTGAPWEPAENPEPDAADIHWLPASPMPADTAPASPMPGNTEQAAPQSGDNRPASTLPRRTPAKPGDAPRHRGNSGTHRKPGRPASSAPASASTSPASAALDGPPASLPAAPDAPPQAEQASGSWESGNGRASAPPWELDADDSSWPGSAEQPAAEAVWQPPAAQAQWDPADPSADTGQFSWRASESTETFPVVGDDS
jgi:hypothetical protein